MAQRHVLRVCRSALAPAIVAGANKRLMNAGDSIRPARKAASAAAISALTSASRRSLRCRARADIVLILEQGAERVVDRVRIEASRSSAISALSSLCFGDAAA